jgi:hypothetical protein
MVEQNRKKTAFSPMDRLLIQVFFSFIHYPLLSITVFFTSGVLFFVIIAINPDILAYVLGYLAQIVLGETSTNYRGGLSDIVKFFAFLSFVLWIFTSVIKFILKRVFHIEFSINEKRGFLLSFALITLCYIIAFIIIFLRDDIEWNFYIIFAIFYIPNSVALGFLWAMKALENRILSKINPSSV